MKNIKNLEPFDEKTTGLPITKLDLQPKICLRLNKMIFTIAYILVLHPFYSISYNI